MCDQLRWDYLSCYGHPQAAHPQHRCAGGPRRALHARLRAVARVRRLAHELLHGPLRAIARRDLERRAAEGRRDDARRLSAAARACRRRWSARRTCAPTRRACSGSASIPTRSSACACRECGFDPYERDDGLHGVGPDGRYDPQMPALQPLPQRQGLRRRQSLARLGQRGAGRGQRAGLRLGHAACAQARARGRGGFRDALHDAPRHGLHGRSRRRGPGACISPTSSRTGPTSRPRPTTPCTAPTTCCPPCAREEERRDPHPVYRAFMDLRVEQRLLARRGARRGHPGLHGPHQADRRPARACCSASCSERGLLDNTLIVFTSDHGDYLGDHWMGEKDLFHEPSVKVPLIVCDPSPTADAARGTVCDALVEAIDLAPTFLEALGADPAEQSHRLEGRSLMPFLRGAAPADVAPLRLQRVRLFACCRSRRSSASSRAMRACSWSRTSAGSTSTPSASGRCCTTSRPTPTSSATSAPIRPARPSASAWRPRWPSGACACPSARRARSSRCKAARGKSQRQGILIGVWDEADVARGAVEQVLGGRDTTRGRDIGGGPRCEP